MEVVQMSASDEFEIKPQTLPTILR